VYYPLFPGNGPTEGGYTIVLYGNNFGTLGSAVVTFGSPVNSLCTFVGIGQSHTQINCKVPPGQSRTVPIIVNVTNQIAPTVYFNYDAPIISYVTPLTSATAGGINVTIAGRNFGLGLNFTLWVGSLVVNNRIIFFNHSLIVFNLPRLWHEHSVYSLRRRSACIEFTVLIFTAIDQFGVGLFQRCFTASDRLSHRRRFTDYNHWQ